MPYPTSYTGRLAPSPTGLLHLGHARTFFIAHQRARAANGTLYLRDEDLDPQRSRPEFSTAMREDLHWLGLTWDADLRQSDRLSLYLAALHQLLAAGLAYPCTCSRRDLAQSTQAPHEDPADEPDDEPIYNNHCRPTITAPATNLSSRPEAHRGPRRAHLLAGVEQPQWRDPQLEPPQRFRPNTNYRFRIPNHHAPITFTDLQAGPQSFTPAIDFGDFLIWRKPLTSNPNDIGLPSYQLACVVDDALTQITEVVRGRDLLKSTARQILLQRALNYPTPAYFHCDLMRDANGIRLAKRHDALSLHTLRTNGLTPTDILAMF
jgi:glutamyl/glutaminyl-tRNA synthetase